MHPKTPSITPPSRRILSLWLPFLATDRLRRMLDRRLPERDRERPLVAVASERGRLTVFAADDAAQRAGLSPGMPLADARAMEPAVIVADADPGADAAALGRLADWAHRYTPWAAVDGGGECGPGGGGLWLDITGCAHLFGGEAGLAEDMALRLSRAGLTARLAVADTPGAAWAAARFGDAPSSAIPSAITIVPPGGQAAALATLPVMALRLAPAVAAALRRVGLRRVGDLMDMPRAALAVRYGDAVALRLDQALGLAEEPIGPRRPVPPHAARLAFAEPIATPDDLHRAARHLIATVCRSLERAGEGARRVLLAAWRVDGGCEAPPQTVEIGASRPNRDPEHLFRLLSRKIEGLEPGPGFEVMTLSVPAADPFVGVQAVLVPRGPEDGAADAADAHDDAAAAELVDRLGARLGMGRIRYPVPRESWWPERAVDLVPADARRPPRPPRPWPPDRPRPVRLLARPEPIEVTAPVPDDPPVLFRWRAAVHRVRHAEGPERIAPEWWWRPGEDPGEARDYYRVEDTEGRRFWLYRLGLCRPGRPAPWFVHGALG